MKTPVKTILIIGDGMADLPIESLGGATPLAAARTPRMDALCRHGVIGRARTIPDGLEPGSDTGILSLMGYDPRAHYTGRSPLEAAGAGISLGAGDVSFRCNLVSMEGTADGLIMRSHSGGGIAGAEADALTDALQSDDAFTALMKSADMTLYPNGSFRPLAVFANYTGDIPATYPPHDIVGRSARAHIPAGGSADALRALMDRAHVIMDAHPVNKNRRACGALPANGIWLWGGGRAASLPSFVEKRGVGGGVVTAVPLVKGIGYLAGLTPIHVPGATGYLDTDCEGKVAAALEILRGGAGFVCVHVEAPDEMSHDGSLEHKIQAIEMLDERVIGPLADALIEPYRLMVAADHYTLLSTRTHDATPVPFFIYDSRQKNGSNRDFNEKNAALGVFCEGYQLMDMLFDKR